MTNRARSPDDPQRRVRRQGLQLEQRPERFQVGPALRALPIGDYPVEVEAWDEAGNEGSAWGEIVIPMSDEVDEEEEEEPAALSVEPPEEPSEPPSSSGGEAPVPPPTKTPKPPKVVTFGGESGGVEEIAEEEIAPEADSSNVLWGAAAAAAAGAAMIVVTAARKKRKDEEKKKAAAASMFNQQQIALEKERAQKAAQRKWEAEQEAERAKAALEAQIIQESLAGIVERGEAAEAAMEAQIIQESLDGIAERGVAAAKAAAEAQVIQESLDGIVERGAVSLWVNDQTYLAGKFQSQMAYTDTRSACAFFSHTMAINVLGDFDINAKDVDNLARFPHENLSEHLSFEWFRAHEDLGITPPAQERFANELLSMVDLPYEAEYLRGGTVDDLIKNLEQGHVTVVSKSYGSWAFGIPKRPVGHAMVLVGYEEATKELIFLDPAVRTTPGGEVFQRIPTQDFEKEWIDQPNWFIARGSMVVYRPIGE